MTALILFKLYFNHTNVQYKNLYLILEIEEIEFIEIGTPMPEVEKDLDTSGISSGVPGYLPLLAIAGSAFVAIFAGVLVVVKYTQCNQSQPKLLN